MTLLDLRRYAIRNRVRVGFRIDPAGECLVNEHGVLKIPSLVGAPNFQFDNSLTGVEQFVLAPVQEPARTREVSREQLQVLLGETPQPAAPDHED